MVIVMNDTIEVFNERKKEIELYINAIEQLYEEKDKNDKDNKQQFLQDDFIKILKSNILLMIYNLVESSVMGGLLEIYEELKQQNLSYTTVSDQIKDIWFSFIFNQVYDKSAHYNSYKEKANDIVKDIFNNKTIVLDRKATNISGNLNADKIRQVCKEHGINFEPDPKSKGGVALNDVKEKRNQLAHGTISFVDCGRDYTLEDLRNISKETNIYIDGLLSDMKYYYENEQFKINEIKNQPQSK